MELGSSVLVSKIRNKLNIKISDEEVCNNFNNNDISSKIVMTSILLH